VITKPTIYTEEFVREQFRIMLEEVQADEGIIYIGSLFANKPYTRQRATEWTEKYQDCQDIVDSYKKIKEIIEARLNKGALTGKYHPVMTIFNLKNNYGWKDKVETDITTGGEKINGINYIKPDGNNKFSTDPEAGLSLADSQR
jgi:hypothetical protein